MSKILPVDFDTEKIRVIKHWKERVMNPMEKATKVNRGYLTAASIICELCVKDVYEQVVALFTYLRNEENRNFLVSLSSIHNITFLCEELRDMTDGEFSFPPLCDGLNTEIYTILYQDVDLNLDKEKIRTTAEAFIKCHDEFLEQYDQQRYKLKLKLDD